jgi:hypothetical protein
MSAFPTLGITRSFSTTNEQIPGWIRRIHDWPSKLSEVELRAMRG